MKTPIQTNHAPVNGLQMYYEVYGEGEIPTVLIHGGGSTIQVTFGTILPYLNGKLLAVELQAHGRTTDRDAPESFEQDADDVAGLLNYLGIEKANFFGFSNGGSTVLQIAIRHPQVVNKIVVASANFRRDGLFDGFFDMIEHATLKDMPQILQESFLAVTPDRQKLQTMFEKDKARMFNFKDWPDDLLKSIKAPAFIISADKDVIVPEHTLKIARLIEGAQMVILPGHHGEYIGEAGYPPSSLPQITAMLVNEFLA